MDEAELQAIRAARLQEMQRNAQGRSSGNDSESKNSQQDKINSYTDSILNQILEPEAKERLNRVRMVKPERVAGVENYLIRLYQSGGIRSKVGEEDIVEILDKIANEERKSTTTRIKFERRGEYEDSGNNINNNNNGNNKNKSFNQKNASSDDEDDFFD